MNFIPLRDLISRSSHEISVTANASSLESLLSPSRSKLERQYSLKFSSGIYTNFVSSDVIEYCLTVTSFRSFPHVTMNTAVLSASVGFAATPIVIMAGPPCPYAGVSVSHSFSSSEPSLAAIHIWAASNCSVASPASGSKT